MNQHLKTAPIIDRFEHLLSVISSQPVTSPVRLATITANREPKGCKYRAFRL